MLGAQELAERRAEHLAAVGLPRVVRAAPALELELPPLARRVEHLAQVHGRAVAQLAREVAELVAAVAVGGGSEPGRMRLPQRYSADSGRPSSPARRPSRPSADGDATTRRGASSAVGAAGAHSCARVRHRPRHRERAAVVVERQRAELQVVEGELLKGEALRICHRCAGCGALPSCCETLQPCPLQRTSTSGAADADASINGASRASSSASASRLSPFMAQLPPAGGRSCVSARPPWMLLPPSAPFPARAPELCRRAPGPLRHVGLRLASSVSRKRAGS